MLRIQLPQKKTHNHPILLTLDNHFSDNPIKLAKYGSFKQKTNGIKEKESGLHNSLEANIKVAKFKKKLCLASSVAKGHWLFFKF